MLEFLCILGFALLDILIINMDGKRVLYVRIVCKNDGMCVHLYQKEAERSIFPHAGWDIHFTKVAVLFHKLLSRLRSN